MLSTISISDISDGICSMISMLLSVTVCSAVCLSLLKILELLEHLHLEASWLAHRTSARRSFARTPKLALEDWDLSHVEVEKEFSGGFKEV